MKFWAMVKAAIVRNWNLSERISFSKPEIIWVDRRVFKKLKMVRTCWTSAQLQKFYEKNSFPIQIWKFSSNSILPDDPNSKKSVEEYEANNICNSGHLTNLQWSENGIWVKWPRFWNLKAFRYIWMRLGNPKCSELIDG